MTMLTMLTTSSNSLPPPPPFEKLLQLFDNTRPGGQDRGARIQLKRVRFGVFSTPHFVPTALSSQWMSYGGSQLTLLRK